MRDSSGPALVLSGNHYGSDTYSQGSIGYYWSSTAYGNTHSYNLVLSFPDSTVYPAANPNKLDGDTIRCIAAGSTNARSYPVSLVYSGYYYWNKGILYMQDAAASIWSSLPVSGNPAASYSLEFGPAYLSSQHVNEKSWGFSLRRLNFVAYPSSAAMRDSSGPALVLSGYRLGSSTRDQESYGGFWSNTTYNDVGAYRLYLNSSGVNPANYNSKFHGFSIRCVAKGDTPPSSAAMRDSSGPALVLGGYRSDDTTRHQGSYGFCWSSTASGNISAYRLYLNSSDVYSAEGNNKYYGLSVRCVAQLPAPLTRVVTQCRWYFLERTIG